MRECLHDVFASPKLRCSCALPTNNHGMRRQLLHGVAYAAIPVVSKHASPVLNGGFAASSQTASEECPAAQLGCSAGIVSSRTVAQNRIRRWQNKVTRSLRNHSSFTTNHSPLPSQDIRPRLPESILDQINMLHHNLRLHLLLPLLLQLRLAYRHLYALGIS